MGDLNGRIGDKQDFNELIDVGDIQKRLSIDNVNKNKNTISREKPTNNVDLQNRRYLTNVIPIDMFSNQRTAHAIENVIDRLQNSHVIQSEIDEIYSEFVDLVQSEMNEKLNYKVTSKKSSRKNGRRKQKHWWNNELSDLWQQVKNNENLYLQCKGTKCKQEQNSLRKNFKESRKDFDKKARQAERQYNAKQRDKITSLKTNDPKTFWDEINKLGPTTTKQEIDCVNLENGSVSYNPDDILKKWKEDFSGLFNDTESNQKQKMICRICLIPCTAGLKSGS
ncbi:uncharacterized protein [Mytilus edulis]|uniref:uncharacterized protein n=1 Tax=Mytilus edulis TaxID=6550 RepID=UPI0039EEAB83